MGQPIPDPVLDQKMNWDQIRELQRDELFTVGGHGATHRILSFLNATDLEQEIHTSLDRLRSEINQEPVHYSYPEGLEHCYSDDVIKTLKKYGIVCSPSAEDGVNRVGDDLFRLKRILVT